MTGKIPPVFRGDISKNKVELSKEQQNDIKDKIK